MPIQIVVSNDMWNEKANAEIVSAYDDINIYVHFDQPISHELEYIENDVTNFYLILRSQGENISIFKANKVLNELMDEAKNFKNGKFKFPVCSLPNAISQSFHATFAQNIAEKPAGTYTIEVGFETDNPLQKGKILAQSSFQFDMPEDSKAHLQKIARENLAQGADIADDPKAKKAAFERINASSEKFETVNLTLINKGSEDIWVMIGFNSGNKYLVAYQQSISLQVSSGENVYRYEGNSCTTNFGYIGKTHAEQVLEIY